MVIVLLVGGINLEIDFIIKNPNNDLVLAKDFVTTVISSEEYLFENFNMIKNILNRQFIIMDNKLFNKDGTEVKLPYEISLRDKLGLYKRAEIIKPLLRNRDTYEIRMDFAFEHHRLVFFPEEDNFNIICTFGFTKIDGIPATDNTNLASDETRRISEDFYSGNRSLWI